MLYRMVKYLDTNKYTKKMVDYDVNDDIFKWRDVPLDLLCLSWSFSTTFSFFIASDRVLRENILSTFGIDKSLYDGFVDFIKNVINLRNNITHNGVVYDSPVKYITDELINLYLFLFKENVSKEDFRLIHLIRMISIISNDMYLYNKTVQFGTNLSIGEPYKGKIAKLFIV
jgi:abortive infection bacteriophage resistance protein